MKNYKKQALAKGDKVVLKKNEQGFTKGTALTVRGPKEERKPYYVEVENSLGEIRRIKSKYLKRK